ncbi:alcohol dehydrogenase catalytic domain-containing protein [Methylocapsa sp. S129]|uniref:alcohol dehydrogenase catalytic domain-containing protein n=1 Tax=Methylocapsa sp. S129 TaxID=1641869 RepID=UPI00131ECEE2|nr:alcohol dehydrogenase catalytic domain-containing protein [Methylocapsa sp. S129]
MRALLCKSPGALEIVERPKPALKAGEARSRPRRAGVCGMDLHIFDGAQPCFEYPRVIGHELAGALNTHRAPLSEATALFPVWIKPETGVIKAIIEI